MHTLIFSDNKRKILEFRAEELQFEQQESGLSIHAEGEIVLQDTAALDDVSQANAHCHVAMISGHETLLDGRFQVTFFVLEPDHMAVLLA